jgi:hypothetical protein
MGDSNTIYEAGQSLVELFKRELTPEPIVTEEAIGLCAPHDPEDYALTIWIYNIEMINETGMNLGYMPDTANSGTERYAPMQLRLDALITAHSKAPAQRRLTDEYRIIGRAMQVVHDTPALTGGQLSGSLSGPGSVMLMQYVNLNSDELAKIWNNTGKMMKPSFGVQLSALSISSNRTRPAAKRVGSATIELFRSN